MEILVLLAELALGFIDLSQLVSQSIIYSIFMIFTLLLSFRVFEYICSFRWLLFDAPILICV